MIDSRLQVTEERLGTTSLPRIIRLCKRFKFNENETRIAITALVLQSGYDREGRYSSYGPDVLSCCQFLDIPLQEMLDFLDPDRLHMQQGLFPEVQANYILTCSISYDTDFCKALMGSQLKANEFLKLEQTYLADVIAEEPGNEHYRDENLGLKVAATTDDKADDKDAMIGEDEGEAGVELGLEPGLEPPGDVQPMAVPLEGKVLVILMKYSRPTFNCESAEL